MFLPQTRSSCIYHTLHVTPENDGVWSASFPSLCLMFHRGDNARALHIQALLMQWALPVLAGNIISHNFSCHYTPWAESLQTGRLHVCPSERPTPWFGIDFCLCICPIWWNLAENRPKTNCGDPCIPGLCWVAVRIWVI